MATRDPYKQVLRYLKNLPKRAVNSVTVIRNSLYETIAAEARKEIKANQISPASRKVSDAAYAVEYKTKTRTTLVESGDYVNSIKAYGRGKNRYVGLPASGVHRPSGLSWANIFTILYEGRNGVRGGRSAPARPHITTVATRIINKNLHVELAKAGFRVKKL